MAYYTFKVPNQNSLANTQRLVSRPYMKTYCMVAMSLGIFISAIGTSRFASSRCIRCFERSNEMTEFRQQIDRMKILESKSLK